VMDPRVKTSLKDLQRQHDLSMICYEGKKKTMGKQPELYGAYSVLLSILTQTDMPPTTQIEREVVAVGASHR